MTRVTMLVIILLEGLFGTPFGIAWAGDGLSVESLVQDVISRSESPHVSDWRKYKFEMQAGYGYVEERNNFTNSAYELSGALPAGAGSQFRFGLRRVLMQRTDSTDKIARTPFKQAAQYSRYELQVAYAYGLMEGRAMTRLSPMIPDFEHATLINVGVHYNLPGEKTLPSRGTPPQPLPGQQPVNSNFNFEIGLRWHLYTPQTFGFYLEAAYQRPMSATGALKSWNYFSGGVLWSIGTRS